MNEEDRKYLIEWMGDSNTNRFFDIPEDIKLVRNKLKEKDLWEDFIFHTVNDYNISYNRLLYCFLIVFFHWFVNPSRFCQLVIDYLKYKDLPEQVKYAMEKISQK